MARTLKTKLAALDSVRRASIEAEAARLLAELNRDVSMPG